MVALTDKLVTVLGAKSANALSEELGLTTVSDLVHHYPRHYRESRSDLSDIVVGEHATVIAEVITFDSMPMRPPRKGNRQEVVIGDGTNTLKLAFFNQKWRESQLKVGTKAIFSGDITEFRKNLQMAHPDYVVVGKDTELGDLPPILAVYPATKNLRSWTIGNCMKLVLPFLELDDDPLPADLRARHNLPDMELALQGIHVPRSWAHLDDSRKRLRWDEAFALQVVLAQRRHEAGSLTAVARPRRSGGLVDAFIDRLPFTLTAGQLEVAEVLERELAATSPMHRLLQGEVGSGKTVLALLAMLTAVDAGGQAALLAPTEVLAAQHFRSITTMLGPLAEAGMLGEAEVSTRVMVLTGSTGAKARRELLGAVGSGEAGIVIGTHALLEDQVAFHDLGLVVVDEQHRFGVRQRDVLRTRGEVPPHVLVMTATPIPRTIAMTVFGDLEVSTLRELPAGRSPISTHVVPSDNAAWLDRMWGRVRDEVKEGRQAFVVFPRIGGDGREETPEAPPSDDEGAAAKRPPLALLELEEEFRSGPLVGLRVGVLHGRLPAEEKDRVMQSFASGGLDVLLATTVVEVGVDVPNATVMIILDAERFGISQLHQLRGRVGRGSSPAWCLLHTGAHPASPAGERLAAVASIGDGFDLAQVDLEHRREGDVLGERQSGRVSRLRLLSLVRDATLIEEARAEASSLVAEDPALTSHPALAVAAASLVDEQAAEFLERG